MSKDLIIAILALAFAGCCGALLVTLAKLDEQKQKTAEEHTAYRNALEYGNALAEALREEQERRWDEISRAVGLENEISYWKEANDDKIKDVLYYHKECEKLATERDTLQDRLSALLCPSNNHIWKDGRCVKCGRVQ